MRLHLTPIERDAIAAACVHALESEWVSGAKANENDRAVWNWFIEKTKRSYARSGDGS